MMASLLLSRVLGIVRDVIISNMFGISAMTDAYRLSFMIPDLLFYLIAGGALSSSFIPVFSEYLHTDREDDAWHIFSSVATIMSILIIAFIVVAWIFAPQLTQLIAGEKPAEILPAITLMSRIILPAQFAFFIGGLLFGTLYSRQLFAVPGLGPNIYNIGIIVGAVGISFVVTPAISGLSWGGVTGAFIGNIIIPIWVMRKIGARYKFVIDFQHEGVKKVFRLMAPVVLGLSLPGVFGMILQYFATHYAVGVNSAYDYANKLMQAPLGIFGQSLAIAAFPALSQFFAQRRMDLFQSQLAKTMRTVLYLAVPVSVFLLLFPKDIILALLQSGKFTPEDTARTAPVLQAFAIGIPAWCLQPVLMRGFFSAQKPWPPIIAGTVMTFLFVTAAKFAQAAGASYISLPLLGSVAAVLLALTLIVLTITQLGDIDIKGIGVTFGKTLLASGAFTAVMWLMLQGAALLHLGGRKLVVVPILLFGGLAAFWVYYYATKALKMPETEYLDRALKRKPKQPVEVPEEPPVDSDPG